MTESVAAYMFGLQLLGATSPDLCRQEVTRGEIARRVRIIADLVRAHLDEYEQAIRDAATD